MLKAVKIYNNTFHSTIKATPIDVQEHRVEHTIIRERLRNTKTRIIGKRNENREEYTENREEGFIKNYRSLRHKEQPKFRKFKLDRVHENNIKRPFVFSAAANNRDSNNGAHQPAVINNRQN